MIVTVKKTGAAYEYLGKDYFMNIATGAKGIINKEAASYMFYDMDKAFYEEIHLDILREFEDISIELIEKVIPSSPFRLNAYMNIINVKTFLESHLYSINKDSGNDKLLTILERLKLFLISIDAKKK